MASKTEVFWSFPKYHITMRYRRIFQLKKIRHNTVFSRQIHFWQCAKPVGGHIYSPASHGSWTYVSLALLSWSLLVGWPISHRHPPVGGPIRPWHHLVGSYKSKVSQVGNSLPFSRMWTYNSQALNGCLAQPGAPLFGGPISPSRHPVWGTTNPYRTPVVEPTSQFRSPIWEDIIISSPARDL